MNEGLNPDTIDPNDSGFSDRWWRETKAMINRGYVRFCRKRGLDPKAGGMRDQIHEDALAGMARQKAGEE